MSFLPLQAQAFSLNGAGAVAGATSLTLKTFAQIDGTLITMADFGSIGYITLEPGNNTLEEQISFSGVTQNANGTATLTGVKTVLMDSPYTETSGLAQTHAGSTTAILSNTSGFYNQFPAKQNDEVITGYWTVPTPLSNPNPATKQYVDNLVSGGSVTNTAIVVTGTAGETVAAGNLVYLKTADGFWWKCDADTASTINDVQLGIAQGAGTAAASITGGVLIRGVDTNQSGLTIGNIQFASNTAGGISSTVGTNPRVIGVARSATNLYFDANFQNRLTDYAVDAVGTDSYAVTLPVAFNAYYAGMTVKFMAGTANTGAATLNVNGAGAKAIKRNVSSDLNTGDISSGQVSTVIYDGTNFQLQSNYQVLNPTISSFVVSGTWTKPSGLKYVIVEVVGGGGGGQGKTDIQLAGDGGGAGGYAKKIIATASLGATETVTIGAGGTGVAGTNGNTGGTTSFGSLVVATGGSGAGTPGIGTTGDLKISGGRGGLSQTVGGGTPVNFAVGGDGGASYFGSGGGGAKANGNQLVNGSDATATTYGAGGGAGANANDAADSTGGTGAGGICIVTEYYS